MFVYNTHLPKNKVTLIKPLCECARASIYLREIKSGTDSDNNNANNGSINVYRRITLDVQFYHETNRR